MANLATAIEGPPSGSVRDRVVRLYRQPLVLCLLLLVIAPLVQLRWGTIHDTSWLITVAEGILDGRTAYVDLFETNPPFSIWLYMPAVFLARTLGLAPELVVHTGFYIAAVAFPVCAGAILRRSGNHAYRALVAASPLILAMLVLPGSAFSQREHLGVMALLPLVALQIWRASPEAPTRPSTVLAIVVGLGGSILFLAKPYFGFAILLPALYSAWRCGSLRPLFAAEYFAIGFAALLYVLAAYQFHPAFFTDVYPVLIDVYAPSRNIWWAVFPTGVIFCLLLYVMWRLRPASTPHAAVVVPLLAAIGAIVPVFIMAKGFTYHAYPAFVLAMLSMLAMFVLHEDARRKIDRVWAIIVAGSILAVASCYWPTAKPRHATVEAIVAAVERPSVGIVSWSLRHAFPLTRMVNGRWATVHQTDWLGISALFLSLKANEADDKAEAARYRKIADTYITQKRAELSEVRPDILVVSKDQTYWIGYLRRFGGLDEMLAGYRVLVEEEDMQVLIRSDLHKSD